MLCLRCKNEEFLLKDDAVIEQEFRKEAFKIQTPAMECTKCGWTTLHLNQIDELRRRTADAYRRKHDLLTSEEIKAYRKLLRKTQREFAIFLGVGEASVKRWETWLVQEKSSDNLIRAMCEKALLGQLGQKTATSVWISSSMPVVVPGKPASTLRWDICLDDLCEPELQIMMAFDKVGEAEAYGASPPHAGAASAALSFSMRSQMI
jgi:putative zinc finger/helix-turn-helix YgiT family protein